MSMLASASSSDLLRLMKDAWALLACRVDGLCGPAAKNPSPAPELNAIGVFGAMTPRPIDMRRCRAPATAIERAELDRRR